MTDSASKRRRLSWASPGKSSPGAALQIMPSGHHEQQDIIEFFAQRESERKSWRLKCKAWRPLSAICRPGLPRQRPKSLIRRYMHITHADEGLLPRSATQY